MFLYKDVLKICSKFTREQPCWMWFQESNFIEITPWHGCFPVNLLHTFITPFLWTPLDMKKAWKTTVSITLQLPEILARFLEDSYSLQKQPSEGVIIKMCSENMQQIYRRTPMPKCDFNKVALELYWNRTLSWLFSCNFAAYFQNTFSYEHR